MLLSRGTTLTTCDITKMATCDGSNVQNFRLAQTIQYFIQIMHVRPCVTDVGGSCGTGGRRCYHAWGASRHNVGQSANSEWWVASRLQPWSLSQQCDATRRHVPPGIPVALVMQGIIP